LLYRYLGWESTMPQFAHLPLLLKPDGEGKLSKRDGDKFGFSVFPLQWKDSENAENSSSGFREDGYLPDAFVNFLVFLGWNPGTQQEIFSMQELIAAFTVERIGKSGVKFDINKAKWFNQQYIKAKTDKELAVYLLNDLQKHNQTCTAEKAEKIVGLLKERVIFPKDFYQDGKYFFEQPKQYDETVISKKWNQESVLVLQDFHQTLTADNQPFEAAHIKHLLHEVIEAKGIKIGSVMQSIRVAITGVGSGADLMEVMAVLGKTEVLSRINLALNSLKDRVLAK
jgi:glutamyl-tRNA synthetase